MYFVRLTLLGVWMGIAHAGSCGPKCSEFGCFMKTDGTCEDRRARVRSRQLNIEECLFDPDVEFTTRWGTMRCIWNYFTEPHYHLLYAIVFGALLAYVVLFLVFCDMFSGFRLWRLLCRLFYRLRIQTAAIALQTLA